jgi:hypothetical protein
MMTHGKLAAIKLIPLLLAGVCSLASAAMADIRVGGAALTMNGEPPSGGRHKGGYQYTGSCPVELKFDWGIVSTDPGDLVYSFVRNDGGQSKPVQASLPGGNRSSPILDGWTLGANSDQFADYRGWVQLNVESPSPLSYRIPFTLHCVAAESAADQTSNGDVAPAGDAVVASDNDGVQASEPPPSLPDYDQPPCPQDGDLWTPGYWGYRPGGGYFWVPGTWVAPPAAGLLWTPGYWGFVGGAYAWRGGYWGPHVGFYGGVNYGFGYGGHGFAGGRWNGTHFAYNTAVTNVNTTIIHNTYRETVINNTTVNNVAVNRTSFNGGPKGIIAKPTAIDNIALRDVHQRGSANQLAHFTEASKNPTLYARANGGHPSVTATLRPAAFNSPAAIQGRGTQMHANAKQLNHVDTARPQTPDRVASATQVKTNAPAVQNTVHATNSTPLQVPSSPQHLAQVPHPAPPTPHPAQAAHPAVQANRPQPQKKEPSQK